MPTENVTFLETFPGIVTQYGTTSPITLSGTLQIDFGATPKPTVLSGSLQTNSVSLGGFLTIAPVTFNPPFDVAPSNPAGSFTFSGMGTAIVPGIANLPVTATVDAADMISGTNTASLSISGLGEVDGTGSYTTTPVCFVEGTCIRTLRGEVRVEDLVVGDLVVTAAGARRPVTWLGHRTIDCRRLAHQAEIMPVRITAHAFGHALPERDLMLSPGHPVLVGADEDGEGGHLVPIMCLINGTTIERETVDEVTYWHVELDAHDILLAEGLPAESYLDWGDRVFFAEGADHTLANPDFVVPGLVGRCRPVAVDGPIVEAERRRLEIVFATRLTAACRWPSAEEMMLVG